MSGNNAGLQNNTALTPSDGGNFGDGIKENEYGIVCDMLGREIELHHYFDSYGYLLRFDLNSMNYDGHKYIGHLSGADYRFALEKDPDNNLVMSTTTIDRNFTDDLEDVFPDNNISNFLIKTDSDMNILWRKHFTGQGNGNCTFGLGLTKDGGYLVSGNTETSLTDVEREFYSLIKLSSECQRYETYDPNYEAPINTLPTQNTVWNSDIKVKGQVIVQDGQSLKINNGATIGFADGKQIYDIEDRVPTGIKVEKGGVLIIEDGATLTGINSCGQIGMWDGIIVEGSSNSNNTGTVFITDSHIENAIYGVFVGSRKYDVLHLENLGTSVGGVSVNVSNKVSKFVLGDDNGNMNGGGRVFGNNATFTNNFIAVRYLPFDGSSNLGNFTNCTFQQNDDYADEYMAQIKGQRTLGLKTFVHMSGIKYNPYFSSCTFDGYEALPIKKRGYGIWATNSKFQVTGNIQNPSDIHFKDLTTGISSSSTGSVNNNIYVSGTRFQDVMQGVNLRGTFGDLIENNHFVVPYVEEENTWGIFTSGASGFSIANNELESIPLLDNTKRATYGIVISNTGGQAASTFNNSLTRFKIGKQFERNNSNIDNFCNNYFLQLHTWVVNPQTTFIDAMKNQGTALGRKADNQFEGFCNTEGDINSSISFSYFDKLGNPNPIADGDQTGNSGCVSGASYSNDASDLSVVDCDSSNDNPCPNPPCLVGDHQDEYDNSEDKNNDRNKLLRTYQHIESLEVITAPDFSSDIASEQLLIDRNTQADQLLLTATYTAQMNYIAANTSLSQAINNNPSTPIINAQYLADFNTFYSTIINAGLNGRTIDQLTEAEYSNIKSLMESETAISENAKAVDYIINGTEHPLVPQEFEIEGERREDNQENSPLKAKLSKSEIYVYPNPFNKTVTFDLGSNTLIIPTEIIVTDISGREVWKYHLTNENQVEWTPTNLEKGLYLYLIRMSDGTTDGGKIIYIQ